MTSKYEQTLHIQKHYSRISEETAQGMCDCIQNRTQNLTDTKHGWFILTKKHTKFSLEANNEIMLPSKSKAFQLLREKVNVNKELDEKEYSNAEVQRFSKNQRHTSTLQVSKG